MGSNFFMRNTTQREEIIEGIIREDQIAPFTGAYGMCKSPTMADITMCRLNGIPWCGRVVQQGPVIVFDFETPGPKYKQDMYNLAKRYGVPLPKVPDELEVYLEHDDSKEDATKVLLGLLEHSVDYRIGFLGERLKQKPNALIIIDPFELFFPIDKNKGQDVTKLFHKLKRLLSEHPKAAIISAFNMRKKDRRGKAPNLLTNPRDWLEDNSGSNDIQSRSDVRLGIDMYDESKGIRVINGIRRGEEMKPMFIRPHILDDGNLAGFEQATDIDLSIRDALTDTQFKHWTNLPEKFKFEDVVSKKLVPRSSLHYLTKRAEEAGFLEQGEDEVWRKVA